MATTPRGRAQQRERYREARQRLRQRHHENQRRRKDKRRAAHQIRISPTDFEACLGRDKFDVYRPLYNVQVMTDLKTDLILVYVVSPCASDSGQLIPLIDLTEAATGRPLRDVLTDSGYPSGEELAFCAATGDDHLQSLAGELLHRQEEGRQGRTTDLAQGAVPVGR